VPAAPLADPELVRLPRSARRRISEIHLVATALAANPDANITHAGIL
jgi:hypothetical protein